MGIFRCAAAVMKSDGKAASDPALQNGAVYKTVWRCLHARSESGVGREKVVLWRRSKVAPRYRSPARRSSTP